MRFHYGLAVLLLFDSERLHHSSVLFALIVQTRLELVAEVGTSRRLVNSEHLLSLLGMGHCLRSSHHQCVRLCLIELASRRSTTESKAICRWVLRREHTSLILDTAWLDKTARTRNCRVLLSFSFALKITLDSEPAAILRKEGSMGRRKFISFLANVVPGSGRVVQIRIYLLDIVIII